MGPVELSLSLEHIVECIRLVLSGGNSFLVIGALETRLTVKGPDKAALWADLLDEAHKRGIAQSQTDGTNFTSNARRLWGRCSCLLHCGDPTALYEYARSSPPHLEVGRLLQSD